MQEAKKYYAVYKPHFENNPRETWSLLAQHVQGDMLGHAPNRLRDHDNVLSASSRAELLFIINSYPSIGHAEQQIDINQYILLPEEELIA